MFHKVENNRIKCWKNCKHCLTRCKWLYSNTFSKLLLFIWCWKKMMLKKIKLIVIENCNPNAFKKANENLNQRSTNGVVKVRRESYVLVVVLLKSKSVVLSTWMFRKIFVIVFRRAVVCRSRKTKFESYYNNNQ